MNSVQRMVIAVSCWLCLVNGAAADLITVPAGLNPGDEYRLAFVSKNGIPPETLPGTTSASNASIAYYNDFVTALAENVPQLLALNTDWYAIASTAMVSAITNTGTTGTGVPIFLVNGTKLVDNYTDLWDGSIDNAFNVFQDGSSLTETNTTVWTGTNYNGSGFSPHFLGTATPYYAFAGPSITDGQWITSNIVDNNSQPRRLYGLSAVLTVPTPPPPMSLPEPSSFLLMATAAGVCGWANRRKRHATR